MTTIERLIRLRDDLLREANELSPRPGGGILAWPLHEAAEKVQSTIDRLKESE